jgi:hypothetical protein
MMYIKKVIEHKNVCFVSTTFISNISHSKKNGVRYYHKSLYGAFRHHNLLGLLHSYPNKFPHSSPEAPRIIQMRETSTSEGGNYYQFC